MAISKKIVFSSFLVFLIACFSLWALNLYTKFKKELNQTNNLNLALQRAKQSTGDNLRSTTEELHRTLLALKSARQQLNEIETNEVMSLKGKIEELGSIVDEKNKSLNEINDKFLELQSKHTQLVSRGRYQGKKIRALENEKIAWQEKLVDLRSGLDLESPFVKTIKNYLDKLSTTLSFQGNQAGLLDSESNNRYVSKITLQNKLSRHQKTIEHLNVASQDLQNQIVKLRQSLSAKNSDLDKRSKDYRKLKEEIVRQRIKIEELERQLFESHISAVEQNSVLDIQNIQNDMDINRWETNFRTQEKNEQLIKEKAALQSRLNQLGQELDRRNESVVLLQKNINELKERLGQKEKEKKSLSAAVTQSDTLKSALNKQLASQKSYFDRIDSLNTQLKTKLSELSTILAGKEAALKKSANKIVFLQQESSSLESRLIELEKELAQLKQARVNISVSPSDSKERAETLKSKIESILKN